LSELGAEIDLSGRLYEIQATKLQGANLFLDEASVMATENTVMAAVLARGETVLGNAACEPHVQDLCRFLVACGAQIEGIESNVLRIAGVERLIGGSWSVGPDHIEVGSFIGMAAITGGDITIEGVRRQDLVSIVPAFAKLGVRLEIGEDTVHIPTKQQLIVEDDLGGMVPKIEDGPWPAFPSDLTSIALTVATQAFGTVLMFEKMFENRLFFTDKLVSMGARIILCDPHRAVVTGPAPLVGQRMESPDIRAGMAMLLAALSAEGQSTIGAAHQIDKGYERIDERLRTLGAAIERVDV
jgi:UDP-N-acetylglucosamine 1-carboxyvinyltransferase